MLSFKQLFRIASAIAVGIVAAVLLHQVTPQIAPVQTTASSTAVPAAVETVSTSSVDRPVDKIDALFAGNRTAQTVLAAPVLQDTAQGISAEMFETGSARYDGEWAVGSYQMAVLGLGQILQSHAELASAYLPAMERSVERLITPEMNQFGTPGLGRKQACSFAGR